MSIAKTSKKMIDQIAKLASKRVKTFGAAYVAFGIFGLLNYPLSFIMWYKVNPQAYTSLGMRLVATLLCIALVIPEKSWPKALQPYMPLYWYLTLLYALPFFGTLMLLLNDFSSGWTINMVLGLFLFVMLVEWLSFVVLLCLGTILALICYLLVMGENAFSTTSIDNVYTAVYVYIFVVVIGAIFSHNKQRIEGEKLQAIQSMASTIAHELRTPLSAIKVAGATLRNYYPKFMSGYKLAKDNNLVVDNIKPNECSLLEKSMDNIVQESTSAFLVIDMLLSSVSQSEFDRANFSKQSISSCVETAIERYPFHPEQRALVKLVCGDDFQYYGNDVLLIHLLYNLIRNALHYIDAAGKGEISISTKKGERYNRLIFRDTGAGISAEVMPKIFNRFYSNRRHGTGLGLPFCRLVMEAFNGKIECRSEEGKYTEFTLYFPA